MMTSTTSRFKTTLSKQISTTSRQVLTSTTRIPGVTGTTLFPTTKGPQGPELNFDDNIFYLKQCGYGDKDNEFWNWCMNATIGSSHRTECLGILGHGERNTMDLKFTTNTELDYVSTSVFGPGKTTVRSGKITLKNGDLNDIRTFCYQVVFGPPDVLPWWVILLIILAVLIALSTTVFFFWKYWLRKRVYPAQGSMASTLDSRFTSAPVSSTASSFVSSNKGPSLIRPSQQRASNQSGMSRQGNSSQASSHASRLATQRSGALGGHGGSQRSWQSRQPTQRSGTYRDSSPQSRSSSLPRSTSLSGSRK